MRPQADRIRPRVSRRARERDRATRAAPLRSSLADASRRLESGVRSDRGERWPRLRLAEEESLLWRRDDACHLERATATRRVRAGRDRRAVRALSRRAPAPASGRAPSRPAPLSPPSGGLLERLRLGRV